MFLDFYQLKEQPFGVTPNPQFLYLGASHREALASLCYGVETGRGLLALIAPPGMGKTTLLFRFLAHVQRSARTVYLFQTQCDSNGFLHYMLRDLGIATQGLDFVTMHDLLNEILLKENRAGKRFVLVIDEAQNLSNSVLETARLLSDFETPNEKLLQIVFAGQPQLAEKLNRPELMQLRQRISILGRLRPFNPSEVNHYIHLRLHVAGRSEEGLFTAAAIERIARNSHGIPRNINNICFNALSLGFALGRNQIDVDLVEEAIGDLDLSSLTDSGQPEFESNFEEHKRSQTVSQASHHPPEVLPQRNLVESRSEPIENPSQQLDSVTWMADANGTFVLEGLQDAEQRGAEILAEVVESDVIEGLAARTDDTDTLSDSLRRYQEPEELEHWTQDAPNNALPVSPDSDALEPTDRRDEWPNVHPRSSQEIAPKSETASASAPSLSYSQGKKSKVRYLPFVAATFVLAILGALPSGGSLLASSDGTIDTQFKSPLIATVKTALTSARAKLSTASLFGKPELRPPSLSGANASPDAENQSRPPFADESVGRTAAIEQSQRDRSLISVTVLPDDDLRQICLRRLGRFDQQVVEEIRRLNPAMRDPNQIITGTHIVLPMSMHGRNIRSLTVKTEP